MPGGNHLQGGLGGETGRGGGEGSCCPGEIAQ
jgi:hypothetical protein